MVKRYGPRAALTCRVVLIGDQSYCEGRVLDVSRPGCLIECTHTLFEGDYVQLRLFFPDQARSMNVPLAAVRWVDGTRVGIEFIRVSEGDQARLAALVQQYIPSSGRTDQRKESVAMLKAGDSGQLPR